MSNTTVPVATYLLYSIYAAEGLAISFGNGLLLLTILLQKPLRNRKEMRIIATLCVADFIYGFGCLWLNGYRLVLMGIGLSGVPSTAWDCIKLPQVFLAQISTQLSAFMNLVVSIDRFICVAFPFTHIKFTLRYSTSFTSAWAAYFVLSGGAMLGSTYFQPPMFSTFNLLCVGAPFPTWYVLYHYTSVVVAGALAVIIYVAVFFSYRSHMLPVGPDAGNRTGGDLNQAKEERRLTVTLGLITISSLIFFIGPFSVLAVFYYLNYTAPTPITVALSMLNRIATIANIVIYVYRQEEVRPGMWKIVTCKWSKIGEMHNHISANVSRKDSIMTNKMIVLRSGSPRL